MLLLFVRSADSLVFGGEILHEPVLSLAEVWHGYVESGLREPVTDLSQDYSTHVTPQTDIKREIPTDTLQTPR